MQNYYTVCLISISIIMYKNKFKIGLFAFNASSGVTLTKNNNRWPGYWKDIKKVALMDMMLVPALKNYLKIRVNSISQKT